MTIRPLARDVLWELAADQHGFVSAQQALEAGITRRAVNQLVHRGTLERAAFGVYRFPRFPVSAADPYMLAVLWTRAPEAALSHETALDVFDVSDVNPDIIHVTIRANRRLRRTDAGSYAIHQQDLEPKQIIWWEEVPIVTLGTAIIQCIHDGTPTYLLRQALERGHAQGRITAAERDRLSETLTTHRGDQVRR